MTSLILIFLVLAAQFNSFRDPLIILLGSVPLAMFGALLFSALMSAVVVGLPPAEGYTGQEVVESVFGNAPRVVAASMIAYFFGEFGNSVTLAKMKILTQGRFLWMRTIGSTIVGEAVDSLIFYPLAFWGSGLIPDERLPQIMLVQFVSKVAVEVMFTPVTYLVVGWLKRAEQEDYYDRDTSFNPFTLRT